MGTVSADRHTAKRSVIPPKAVEFSIFLMAAISDCIPWPPKHTWWLIIGKLKLGTVAQEG